MELAHFYRRHNQWIIPLGLCIGALILFFFRLGMPTLEPWDEAWYGAVAQTIVKSNNWVYLKWQGEPFLDHPPMGMWLMALSYTLFGVTEFSTRLPSAIAGVFTVLLMYLSALHLYQKKSIGVVASIILTTSVWYLLRVRSGNLDALLVFFFIGTFYSALRSKDEKKWFPISMMFFGCLMMTKTLIGAAMVPVLIFLNWQNIVNPKRWNALIFGIILFVIIVFPWYQAQFMLYPNFAEHHFKTIGMRNQSLFSYFIIHPKLPLYYLHMGVRKWYYLWIVAGLYSFLSLRWKSIKTASVFVWLICMIFPFLGSSKTELWHLIPVYLPLSLITSSGIYYFGNDVRKYVVSMLKRGAKTVTPFLSQSIYTFIYMCAFLTIGIMQFYILYPEVFPQYHYVSDSVDVGKNAKIHSRGKLYLNESFLPVIAFYSGKDTYSAGDIVDFWKSPQSINTSVIVGTWGIQRLKNEKLQSKTLYHNNSYYIITH